MSIEDYKQQEIEEEGTYRGYPFEWGIQTFEATQSVALKIRFCVHQRWHPKERCWSQEWPIGWFVDAQVWLVKKDGSLNNAAVTNLQKCGLWNGDWDQFSTPPPNVFSLIDVQAETYEGKTRYRGAWVNPDAPEPATRGSLAPADPELLKSLRSRFQGATRAIAGGSPAGTPPVPSTAGARSLQPQPGAFPQAQPQAQPPQAARPQQASQGQPGVPGRPTAPPQQQMAPPVQQPWIGKAPQAQQAPQGDPDDPQGDEGMNPPF